MIPSNGSSRGARRIVSASSGSMQSRGDGAESRRSGRGQQSAQATEERKVADAGEFLPDINNKSARLSQNQSRQSLMSPSERAQRESDGLRMKKPGSATRRPEGSSRASATPKGSASAQQKPGGFKSFMLSEQFQADQLMEQASQRQKRQQDSMRASQNLTQQLDGMADSADGQAVADAEGERVPGQRQLNLVRTLDEEDVQVQSFVSHPLAGLPEQPPPIDFHQVGAGQPSHRSTSSRQPQPGTAGQPANALAQGTGSQRDSSARLGPSKRQSATAPPKKVNAWESFEVNQFKVRNQEPGQIIDKLKQLTANDIPFMGELPPSEDMDSTDPLDSLMCAFVKIITDKAIDFTAEVKGGIHLATGTRTDFCDALLTFICHHQKLEQAFRDSVDFFMESLTSVVKLEEENKSMKQNITHLLNLKEDGILVKFNLEKRLKEQIANVERITEKEKQAQNKIKQLQKQLADKNAECDSLQYRLHHFEEINNMMDPPGVTHLSAVAGPSGGAVPNPTDEDKPGKPSETQHAHAVGSAASLEHPKIRDLQTINKRLEEELQQMREVQVQKDNSDHFRKIQELFNKIQIENKNLRIYNQKCESKLESKQNLINHLESKVTSVMVEKEEIIIKLKSEIVLLKNKLELNEEKFQEKLGMQQRKLEYEFKSQYNDKIKDLEGQVSDLEKQKKDQRKRLTRLNDDHKELSQEFTKFRREKEDQESLRNKQFKSLEDKISSLQLVDDEKINQLNKQIEGLENQNEVIKKENNILQLRQKYLKQQTETLAKQKVFLFETLNKGEGEIQETLAKMKSAMMADNNNQAYLVSVEKCIKQAGKMADMGTAALQNIQQILQFLKIEKLHQLLSDEDELEQLEKNIIQSMHVDQEEQRVQLEQQQAQRPNNQKSPVSLKGDGDANASGRAGGLTMIQRFLNKHGMGDSTPNASQSSNVAIAEGQPKNLGMLISQASSQPPQQPLHQVGEKNEDYYLNNCPVELASICVKLLVDILVQVGKCKSIADVPPQVSQLLQKCNKKSDQIVEREILNKYLNSTKSIIDKQIGTLRSQQMSDKEFEIISDDQKQQIQEQILNPSSVDLPILRDLERPAPQSRESLNSVSQPAAAAESCQPAQPAEQSEDLQKLNQVQSQAEQLKLELQRLKIKLEEQKMKSRNLQLNLAGKIVVLEEQIEQINQDREDQIQQLEKTHQEELQGITSGVEQREAQLLQLCDEYRDEVRDLQFKLETSWKPAEESKTIQKMEKGTRGNLYRLMKDEYERLFRKNSELLNNYQASINEFVYLREDLRGSFTLAFDCERLEEGLLNMLNESMLKYYLSKTFVLDKSKFRFLRSEQLFEQQDNAKNAKTTQIMKIIIEVVAEDQGKVAQLFKNVKAQIKDGTSLLYDFMPLYFGMNLGSSGFSTHHNLKDFALLSKTGQIIDGEDYVVSVMRNKHKPLIFKIIAFNLELREEFMMELSESDIYELVEGDQQVLKNLEPDALIKKITTNLNLIVRDKIKVLTCEQKIFFNEIWMQNMESGKNHQVHIKSIMETQLHATDIGAPDQQQNLIQSFLTHTAARTSQLSRLQPKNIAPPQAYLDKFNCSVASQTDYEISTLYEGFENVYRGVQKVGEITHMRLSIQESTKTNTLVFTFDDLTSLKKLKFSLYEKDSDDQYVVHSECMKITDGHHVLVSVEQIQQQGLLIRMHDMLECKSVNFSLLRKQNGQFTRLSEDSSLDLLMKDDFRNFIYELTFVVNKQANENWMQNMQYLFREDAQNIAKKSSRQMMEDFEQKKQIESQKRESTFKKQASGKLLPRRKRALYASRVYSFSQKAFYKDKWSYLAAQMPQPDDQIAANNENEQRPSPPISRYSNYMDQQNDTAIISDWRDIPGEKGILLYRNIFTVRCIFNGSEEAPQESVITLYLKDHNVNIQVSLYKEQSKMSIASSVLAVDLFGEDPMSIPFKDRINLLNSMMEKFFIISEASVFDGKKKIVYHMKVESDAVPIQTYLEEKKKEAILKNPKENKAQEYDVILIAQKIREIQDEKDVFLTQGKAIRYSRFTEIDGEVHEVEMLFIKKQKVKTEKSGGRHAHKRFSTYGKTQVEIAQIQIEQFLEEQCDWDSIYFEIIDQNRETVSALYDKKKLPMMLSKDEFFDWKSAMSTVDPYLLDYIKKSIKVDKVKNEVSLHNKENVEQNIYQKFRRVIGGKYLMRTDLELAPDEKKIVQKQMISNMEIEMSEFLYDIKIYQVQKMSDKDIIAYQIELFTLNDPDVVYLYNYPMNFSSETQDPHSLVIDVVDLIRHPLKTYVENKKGKLQNKGNTTTSPGAGGLAGSAAVGPGQFQKQSAKDPTMANHAVLGSPAQDSDASKAPVYLSPQQKVADNRMTFQQLFRKYIDNRVLLFIQESRFPRTLDFILVEPCSQLQWRYHIEPRQITTGMASMHLVDQATLEMFVSVLLDENEHCSSDKKLYEYQGVGGQPDEESLGGERSQGKQGSFIEQTIVENWSEIKELQENAKFVSDCVLLDNEIALSISKKRNAFNIELCKPNPITQEDGEALVTFDGSTSRGEGLEIRVNPQGGDTQFAKIIRARGLSYCVLFVKIQGTTTIIKVVQLSPTAIKTVFKFTFIDDREQELDSDDERERMLKNSSSPIFTAKDLQASTVDALRRYYGAQTIEQAIRMCENQKLIIDIDNDDEYEEPTVFEKMEDEKPSIHATRMLAKYMQSLDTRTVVLHRKTFYDDQHEKLIIMHVRLKYVQRDYLEMFFLEDMEAFNVVLQEPESGQETEYITPLQQCLQPEELLQEAESGGLKDMKSLKRLAKKILEDRVEIRRINDNAGEESKREGAGDSEVTVARQSDVEGDRGVISHYTFDITFDRERNLIQDRSVASGHGPSPLDQKEHTNSPSGLSYQDQDQQQLQEPSGVELGSAGPDFQNQEMINHGTHGGFGPGRAGNYADYQTTILEEAASNEEDLDPHQDGRSGRVARGQEPPTRVRPGEQSQQHFRQAPE